jgi:hypothetical protein
MLLAPLARYSELASKQIHVNIIVSRKQWVATAKAFPWASGPSQFGDHLIIQEKSLMWALGSGIYSDGKP